MVRIEVYALHQFSAQDLRLLKRFFALPIVPTVHEAVGREWRVTFYSDSHPDHLAPICDDTVHFVAKRVQMFEGDGSNLLIGQFED